MKSLTSALVTIVSFCTFSQKTTEFNFFDPCTGDTLELDYQLWYYDSTINVKAGSSVILKEEYYLLSTQLTYDDTDWIAIFSYDIYSETLEAVETLYLRKLRPVWNGLLHPQLFEFRYCDDPTNGSIVDQSPDGVTVAKGEFLNGTPLSNVKYYDEKGQLKEKWFFSNGHFRRIKKYKIHSPN